jgi:hypothetical protein
VKHNVKIIKIELCGCGAEGNMIIRLNEVLYKVYYQMPDDYIEEFFIKKSNWIQESSRVYNINENESCNTLIDLWLVYGDCKIIDNKIKHLPSDLHSCGGRCKGEIVNISKDGTLRIDCGILIDVDIEFGIPEKCDIGEYVEISGTYQAYLPNTDFER